LVFVASATLPHLHSRVFEALAEVLAELLHFHSDFLAHQVETHRDQSEADEDVDEVDDQFGLVAVLGGGPRDEVPESQLAQTGDAEVGAVEVRPLLPLGEHDGSGEDVGADHPEARRRGHDDPPVQLFAFPGAALVQPSVHPLEAAGEDLAHVEEVQDVERDPDDGVDHRGELPPAGARHQVPVPDHGDDAQREHERGGERPHLPGVPPVVTLLDDDDHLVLEAAKLLVGVQVEGGLVEDVVVARHVPQLARVVAPDLVDALDRGVVEGGLDPAEAHGADQGVAHHQRPHAHLGAHESDELAQAVFDFLAGVHIAGRGRFVATQRAAEIATSVHGGGD
jgi:hypothetical protein